MTKIEKINFLLQRIYVKKVGFFIFSLFIALNIIAEKPIEDSLLTVLPHLKGEMCLKMLYELQEQTLYQPQTDYYNNLLLEEAKKQQNTEYIAIALTNRVAHFRFTDNMDSLLYHAKIAEEFNFAHKYYRNLFICKQIITFYYLQRGYWGLGKEKMQEMCEEAKKTGDKQAIVLALISLGDTYRWMGQYDRSIRYLKEARSLYEPMPEAPYKILDCYVGLILANLFKQDRQETLLYLDSLQIEMSRIKKNYPIYNLVDYELIYRIGYAYWYIVEKRLDEAWKKIDETDKILQQKEIPYYTFLLVETKMRYYHACGNDEKTQYYFNIFYDYCKEHHWEQYISDLLKFRAELLCNKGLYEEAADVYRNLLEHTDSTSREKHLYEIEQIRINYEVDKKESEIVNQKEDIKRRLLSIFILTILIIALLTLLAILWKSWKSTRHKSFLLFNQIKELTQTKAELLTIKEKAQLKTDVESTAVSDFQINLFERVETYMTTQKPYIDNEYGRKNLIADMNTNEVYLAKAIRSGMNMTIQEYINKQRMEYAKTLLLQDTNQTIEVIAMDAGFTSLRTFYRLFKEAYGMSPAEFRKLCKK
jgi:AraC-like DNA-binding protein